MAKSRAKKKSARPSLYLPDFNPVLIAEPSTVSYLRSGLKLIRKLYSGFDPESGFDARKIKHWPTARVHAAQSFISQAHLLVSGAQGDQYVIARPRTDAQVAALQLRTSQVSTHPRQHPLKGYVIYTNTPKRTRVVYREEEVPMGFGLVETRLRVEVRQQMQTGPLVNRDYLFREVLGFQPGVDSHTPEGVRLGRELGTLVPWEQMELAMARLARRIPARVDRGPKRGEEAYYQLLSVRGPVGSSIPHHMLVERMIRWGEHYVETFAETLIGVRYQGDEFKAVRGDQSLDARRERRQARYRKLREQLRRERAKLDRRARAKLKKKKPTRKK